MAEWQTPVFEEIRMDAEINCYSSALHDLGAVGSAHATEGGAECAADRDDRVTA